jgi:large subunit ribosomal protein L13
MEYTIDAQKKNLGRIATEAAHMLMGKSTPDFEKNMVADITVRIINSDQLAVSLKKSSSKVYTRYTGYPGGLRKQTLQDIKDKKGMKEVIQKAVYGMLPVNKLRAKRMKRLIVD